MVLTLNADYKLSRFDRKIWRKCPDHVKENMTEYVRLSLLITVTLMLIFSSSLVWFLTFL